MIHATLAAGRPCCEELPAQTGHTNGIDAEGCARSRPVSLSAVCRLAWLSAHVAIRAGGRHASFRRESDESARHVDRVCRDGRVACSVRDRPADMDACPMGPVIFVSVGASQMV
jgi:hypothetical protein